MKLNNIYEITNEKKSSVEYSMDNMLIAKKRYCKKCRNKMILSEFDNNVDGFIWRCQKKKCETKKSIKFGSFFEKSNLSIGVWIKLIYFWSIRMPILLASRQLEISRFTCRQSYKYCRQIAISHFEDLKHIKIGGLGKIVEIDESVISKRKYHRGRIVKPVWLFGGIERGQEGKFFFEIVPNRTEATLLEVIHRRIEKDSLIISDKWKSYHNLDQHGYLHEYINHSRHFVDPLNQLVHTQTIESRWSSVKRFLRNKGTNISKNLHEYLFEYLYRWKFGDNSFEQILIDISMKYEFNQ